MRMLAQVSRGGMVSTYVEYHSLDWMLHVETGWITAEVSLNAEGKRIARMVLSREGRA